MDSIYLDTSIFEANNFLESKRINQILKLAEQDYIQIVLPAITYHEIKNRARKNIDNALSKAKRYRDETKVLRNIDSLNEKFELPDANLCIKEFEEIFDKKLIKAKCLKLEYPTVNIKKIFDCYFTETFPFSIGQKKHEFPDAFALISIEEWCREQNRKCYVFSKDADFHGYSSEHLIIEKKFEDYLDETLIKIEDEKNTNRLNLVHEAYKNRKDELINEIEQWLTNELEDESTYYRCFNYFEIHNIDIEEIAVELEEYQIVSVTDSTISIETKANIIYEVVVEADDENSGYYDSEDKVWHSLGTETRTISDNTYMTIMLKADIPIAGDDFLDIEISEINEGNELKLPGKYY